MSITSANVAVLSKSTLSDGAIAVTFRPNSDATGDSVSTLYVTATTAQADIDAWVAAEKQRVADQYNAMQAAHSALASIT